MIFMTFKSIELFAGAGGLALGLEMAGFRNIALNEINRHACDTLRKNKPLWKIYEEGIEIFSSRDLIHELNIKIGELDLLSGGHPCQAFSYAGKNLGLEDTRGTLFYYYAKILKKLLPKVFLFENVRGLLNHDNGRTLNTIRTVFESEGYKVYQQVLDANDYGVAQKRHRLILIGVRNDLNGKIIYNFPTKHNYKPVLRDILMDVPNSLGQIYPESKREILKMVPPGGCWRDLPDDIAKLYMKKSYYLGGGRTGMARRLSMDEPSLTLTTSPQQMQTERCHPIEIRPFTIREYARIQSFPDYWNFEGTVNEQYKQIGNAVPVLLAYELGKSINRSLGGTDNV
jgi:DNA (cytosine-5)-methyltransferase 1